MTEHPAPSLNEIKQAANSLQGKIVNTPVVKLSSDRIAPYLPDGAEMSIKLELFQQAGSFKARGALLSVEALNEDERQRGITTVSAGNHALAASWAANKAGVHAKVVMTKTADPIRVAGCRAQGAEVILVEDIHAAFDEVERIKQEEGRTFVHPFEGRYLTLGTGTCGYEYATQVPDLDVAIVPIGGGGLISGMSTAFKAMNPKIEVIGVEPFGADSMYRSFQSGQPEKLEKVQTIADSLGSPLAMPYSFAVAHAHVDRVVRIEDEDMLRGMAVLYDALKIAVEPAGAASTAAAMSVLKEELAGKRVGVIACGSNIGADAFAGYVAKGRELL
ncbi:threonine/serine dehydratase [Aestuariispira ectoiniformans]|uniref:threonine/serine dehydratase n=1 Tax=Aestuariispira ectoiniformans TaxID=2775080 RepID=UPI00223A6C37|nr:threonine/serine dehydratase [Aestuariispira ectoiniformans]